MTTNQNMHYETTDPTVIVNHGARHILGITGKRTHCGIPLARVPFLADHSGEPMRVSCGRCVDLRASR